MEAARQSNHERSRCGEAWPGGKGCRLLFGLCGHRKNRYSIAGHVGNAGMALGVVQYIDDAKPRAVFMDASADVVKTLIKNRVVICGNRPALNGINKDVLKVT